MGAVGEKVRVEFRSRWKSLVALALILGVPSGMMIAAEAAARRTDSALERFNDRYRLPDQALLLNPMLPGAFTPTLDQIARLPGVRQATYFKQVALPLKGKGEIGGIIPDAASAPALFRRVRLLTGRMPSPDRPEEILVGLGYVRMAGWHAGSRIALQDDTDPLTPALKQGDMIGASLRVVGTFVAPDGIPQVHAGGIPFIGTPALLALLPAKSPYRIEVYLDDPSDAAPFQDAVERLAAGRRFSGATDARQVILVPAQRALHLQASALRLLAIVGGLSLALVFSQSLSRMSTLLASDAFVLRAIGMTPRQQWAASMTILGGVGFAGAIVAGLTAFLLSPLAPLGDARSIELRPGFLFDVTAVAIGTAIVACGVAIVSALLSRRAVGSAASRERERAADASSSAADALSRAGMSPAAVVGARFAFDRSRGRTALPARTTIAEAALSVAGFAMALTCLSGLNHFLDTPRLYGKWWDERVTFTGSDARTHEREILAQRGVSGLVYGVYHDRLVVNGAVTHADRISVPARGETTMPIVEGRLPVAPDEIALGRLTMREQHLRLGEEVTVSLGLGAQPPLLMRIVGVAVFEVTLPRHGLGSGAVITFEAGERLGLAPVPAHAYVMLDRNAASSQAFRRGLAAAAGAPVQFAEYSTPASVLNFGNVRALPNVMAAILALFGVATLLHATISVVRLRRRDLAILKSIGFDRRQIAATVAWQATIIAAVAAAIGLPAGVLVGRFLWLWVVSGVGGVPVTHLSAAGLALIPAATVATALVVAAVPGRRAAAMPAAITLRTE